MPLNHGKNKIDGQLHRELASKRSHFYSLIRSFLIKNNFVEVETPILSTHLIPESSIEIFRTNLNHPHRHSDELYLSPSPEMYMKLLINQGVGDCFQLTKAFRNAEHYSKRHYAEFTMLEWYALDKTYIDNIETTKNLLRHMAEHAAPRTRHYFEEFVEITMSDLFCETIGIDLNECVELVSFKTEVINTGNDQFIEYANKSETWEELFNYLFIGHVEPHIPVDKTVFVKDYPFQIPTTARRNGNHYERWEFYMRGWEMANCYTEESRYDEMYALFKNEETLKNKMMTPHHVDYDYLEMFRDSFPDCSGVAMGVDRVFSVFLDVDSLDAVSLFPVSESLK